MLDVLGISRVLGKAQGVELIKGLLDGRTQVIRTLGSLRALIEVLDEILPVEGLDHRPQGVLIRRDLGIHSGEQLEGLGFGEHMGAVGLSCPRLPRLGGGIAG